MRGVRRFRRGAAVLTAVLAAVLTGGGYAFYRHFMAPTRILVVNALKAQQADFVLAGDSRQVSVDCVEATDFSSLGGYDAVIVYARRLVLTDRQQALLSAAGRRGVVVFTKTVKASDFNCQLNLTAAEADTLQQYFSNENRQNFRNGLRYLRHVATPHRWGDQGYDVPMAVPANMFYHRQYGQYFLTADSLTAYLRRNGLYHEGGQRVALVSGITFPMEGNREHVDTLITLLTRRGLNVYPLTANGPQRAQLLQQVQPAAVVYMAMGRLAGDSLVGWLHSQDVALFCPFPVSMTHSEWASGQPLTAGTKNSRIVIPEIDGGTAPFCIGTQNTDAAGYYRHTAEAERCTMVADHVSRRLLLRTKPNRDKRIAIGYFRRPGRDALLASGMEVIPSLYNFLLRLRYEGYDVSGLPPMLAGFARQVKAEGVVLGSYAQGAQQRYMDEAHPHWIGRREYEQWVADVLPAECYAEVVDRYGEPFATRADGSAGGRDAALLRRGDSVAVACLQYGNVLLFPQPRPALGDDDFRLEHGAEVAPPHSYLLPYLYMQRGFRADALVHFGTHGNLEFTPGRDAAMRAGDWSQQLIGSTPHFYFYTTANIGEAVIAKRRSGAVLVTYLTPPYAESGMRRKYQQLHERAHRCLEHGAATPPDADRVQLKRSLVGEGLHRPLGIDSTLARPLTDDELERLDAHLEELMSERMQGAYYTLGQPYTDEQLRQTVRAMNDDPQTWPRLRRQLLASTRAEMDNMVRALSGGSVAPAPGGDPVMNDNVLPTGRNMYSINPDNTPDEQAWEDGRRLAEATLADYRARHGEWPRKVSYTFWAGEFIATGGATVAQALWMLGVEPERDSQGRISSLRLVPRRQLGRPRVNVVVQVSGQLRDIADSRLKLITEAIRLATAAEQEDSNYVREGTLAQERELIDRGVAPQQARQLSVLRVFGPANNGYSTGMMDYIERSGQWQSQDELADAYLNNMCAAYGDEQHWGTMNRELFAAALQQTAVVVQPRQSNTWGPVSLDHVYEFTGGLSMAVKQLTGREPDALMADYRNPRRRRMQGLKEAIDVEVRTTVLNPQFIRERMKGDEGTAQMFGETFRNVFGWNATRPSALDPQLYDQLYRLYVSDEQRLGVRTFFLQKNPAAYQAMTATLLESARKGYWRATADQLRQTAQLHADVTREAGAACTDFVCNNAPLQQFVAGQLPTATARQYTAQMQQVKLGRQPSGGPATVLERQGTSLPAAEPAEAVGWGTAAAVGAVVLLLVLFVIWLRRRQ